MAETNGPPPWWRWYEPPRWFPRWLHLAACTHCRAMSRYVRDQERAR
jgi:hypothetical protein